MEKERSGKLCWEISVPIFKTGVILKDLALALGIPFGLLIILLLLISGGDISSRGVGYPLISIGLLFIFGFLFIMVLYRGRYDAGYEIDSKGILNYTQQGQRRKNKAINLILIVLGFFTGRPSVAGTGVLAQSRQSVSIRWKDLRKVKIYPKSRTIVAWGGFACKIAIFCNDDNFADVRDAIMSKFCVNEE